MEINNTCLSCTIFKDYVKKLSISDLIKNSDVIFIQKLIMLSKEFKKTYEPLLNKIIIKHINKKILNYSFTSRKMISIEETFINPINLYKMLIKNDDEMSNSELLEILKYNFIIYNDKHDKIKEINTFAYLSENIIMLYKYNKNYETIKFLIIYLKMKYFITVFENSLLNNKININVLKHLYNRLSFMKIFAIKFANKYNDKDYVIYNYILPYCEYIDFNMIKYNIKIYM